MSAGEVPGGEARLNDAGERSKTPKKMRAYFSQESKRSLRSYNMPPSGSLSANITANYRVRVLSWSRMQKCSGSPADK